MKTAFSYVRVSTNDQEQKGNSIPEQLFRIENFARNENIDIVKTYQDTGSAFHDENRPQFNQMITDALEHKVNYIIVDESSRFARNQEVSIVTKNLLQRHNISVLYANELNVDYSSISGVMYEGFRNIQNQTHSMAISQSTIRGMAGNIKQRDPESGWCYKNGGRAPYGYMIKSIYSGTDSKGKAVYKSIWEVDPENSIILKSIIVDLYTNKEMSYEKIRDHLNSNNIPSRSGGPWGTSTIVEMLRDERLEQYAGTGFWNKENHKTSGSRFNPREEWIIVPNAHPAIITNDELRSALERKNKNKKEYTYNRTKDSPYLFSGKNFNGDTLFTCNLCGSSITGRRNSSAHWRKYNCSRNCSKGAAGCMNDLKIDVVDIETKVLQDIERLYTKPNTINKLIDDIKQEVKNGNKSYHNSIKELNVKKNELEKKRSNLLDAIERGVKESVATDRLNELQDNIEGIYKEIKLVKENPPKALKEAEEDNIRTFFTDFKTTFDLATLSEKKVLIKTFVRNMILDPEKQEVRVTYFPDLVQTFGVGRGSHAHCTRKLTLAYQI